MNLTNIFQRSTANGAVFDFASISAGMINARDLVHHLARVQCWNGNTHFVSYSVAQHGLVVMSACRLPAARIYALLNCAPAAFLGWADAPFKLWIANQGGDLIALEHRIFAAALEHFRVEPPTAEIFADVHQAEHRTEATEWRDVVMGKAGAWAPTGKPLPRSIKFRPTPKVEDDFAAALERELLALPVRKA